MRFQSYESAGDTQHFVIRRVAACVLLATLFIATQAEAGVLWDAGGGSQYWFNPVNWTNDVLPPSNNAAPTPGSTDTDITIATGTLPGGEGIVYDPTPGSPFFPPAPGTVYPVGFEGGQTIAQLYVARVADRHECSRRTNRRWDDHAQGKSDGDG